MEVFRWLALTVEVKNKRTHVNCVVFKPIGTLRLKQLIHAIFEHKGQVWQLEIAAKDTAAP